MPGDRANGAINQCGIGKTKFPNIRGELPRLYTPERPGVTGERDQSFAGILSGPYSAYRGAQDRFALPQPSHNSAG